MTELPADPDALITAKEFQGVLRCGRTVWKDMEAAGQILEPDCFVGKTPRWRAGRVRAWIQMGCPPPPRRDKPAESDRKRPFSAESDRDPK